MAEWDPFADPADTSTVDTEEPRQDAIVADIAKAVAVATEVPLNPWDDAVYVEQAREAAKAAAEQEAVAREAAKQRAAERECADRKASEKEVVERQRRVAARDAKREAELLTPEERKSADRRQWIQESAFQEAMGAARAAPAAVAAARLDEEEGSAAGGEAADSREQVARVVAAQMGVTIKVRPAPAETQPVGLLFPDQSSRSLRLLSAARNLPGVPAMLQALEATLGFSPLEPVPIQGVWELFRGPEAIPVWLEETSLCQPVMYVSALAAIERLKERKPRCLERCRAVAGLSLGELAALTFAGVFDFHTGLRLASLRGEAMQEAAEEVPQRMVSVAGLDRTTVQRLCDDSRSEEGDVCQIAQCLFSDGFLCSGNAASVEAFATRARQVEGCKQVQLLKATGSGAFHTSLMAPARARLLDALTGIQDQLRPPQYDVYMGANARKIDSTTPPAEIISLLCDQLVMPVRWEETIRAMLRDGVGQFYECGPMQQLKGIMKRIDEDAFGTMLSMDHVVKNQKEKLR